MCLFADLSFERCVKRGSPYGMLKPGNDGDMDQVPRLCEHLFRGLLPSILIGPNLLNMNGTG